MKIKMNDNSVEKKSLDKQTDNEDANRTKKVDLSIKKLPSSKKSKLKIKQDVIPRGQPKSGRPWKEPKEKFSNIKKSIYRRPFHKKLELRQELKHIKQISKSIKDAKKEENEIKKQRRIDNAERRLENQRKSEIVQIIKNPNKLKRMKKKHLRMIEKRDLDKVKVV